MASKPRPPSPMMGTVSEMVQDLPSTFLSGATHFSHTMEVDVALIDPDPEQARKTFAAEEIELLAATMKAEGQLQPILLRKNPDQKSRWIIIAGERRWRAAKHLKWNRILAAEHSGDAAVASLLENLQRIDLNILEEARGLRKLLEHRGWSQAKAAETLGKRRTDINGILGILDLPEEFVSESLNSDSPVSRNALIELARVPPGPVRNSLIELAKAGKLTIPTIRAARGDVNAKPENPTDSDAEQSGDDGPAPLSLKIVGNLRSAIKASREARRILGGREREQLQQLAREIAELLEMSDRAFN